MAKAGDRIELISMEDDPDPIPSGTKGTVDFVSDVGYGRDKFTQIGVKWDNGRTLMLTIPPDSYRIIK